MKELYAEQPPGENYWNVWLIEGEKNQTIEQIFENDPIQKIRILRDKIAQTQGVSLSQAFKEIKKIVDWKNKKSREKKPNPIQPIPLEEKKTNQALLEEKAQELLNQYELRTIEDTKEIFYYSPTEGIYLPAERMLETIIQSELGEKASRYNTLEILAKIQRSTYVPREKQNDPNLIPLKNGIFNIQKQKCIDFSPEYFFTSKHPIEYNPMAMCPKINKFLDEVAEGDIEKVWLLEKIAAYAFYRGYPIHKAFMMLGNGSNGKSVYLNLLRAMLGDEHVCAIQLQDLANNRFAGANLYRKNANIFADLESHALKSTGLFKALTGGDYITCDQKFKASFPFVNTAKLIFSCNQLPETVDESDAFMRRWIIVEFNKQFVGSEQNPNLLSEITTTEELSGFFDRLSVVLKELLQENQFNDESIQTIREKYMRNANSAISFIEENIQYDTEAETKKTEILHTYKKYCQEKRLPPLTDRRLWQNLHEAFGDKAYETFIKDFTTGSRMRVWKGIRFIKKEEETIEKKIHSIADRLLFHLKSYQSKDGLIPLDYIYSLDWGEELLIVQACVKEMKKNGLIYEPVNGFIRIGK